MAKLIRLPSHIDRTRRLTPLASSRETIAVAHRPCQPIEIGDGEAVALTHVVECRLKLPARWLASLHPKRTGEVAATAPLPAPADPTKAPLVLAAVL